MTHAFNGETYFKLKLAAFDVTMTRIVRVIYRYTPEWPYCSTRGREKVDAASLDLSLQLLLQRPVRGGLKAIALSDQRWLSIDPLLVRGALKPGIYMHVRKN